jgi:hypothetical protein
VTAAVSPRLTLDEVRVAAAYRSLLAARAATGRCPSAQNIAAEREAQNLLDRYLDRLPRKETS